MKRSVDESWMKRALRLAAKGRGRVHPNPLVGAVVVKRGRCLAEGWHRAYGLAHAEAEALARAGRAARGATLYVTLEPCTHWGKTPPCVDAVLRSGVRRVVVAMEDPNPRVSGGGIRRLKRRGIRVETGVCEAEARRLNRAFVARALYGRPHVTLKAATSLDGRAATVTGESKWITGPEAREAGHRLRAGVDAIAIGAGTAAADRPSLISHGQGRHPIRVLFDSRLMTPVRGPLFDRAAPTWVVTTDRSPASRRRRLMRRGVRLILAKKDPRGRVDISDALKRLSAFGVGTLLVEGGPTLAESFRAAGAIDSVAWFIAPMVLGGSRRLSGALRMTGARGASIGPDFLIEGEVER